MTTANMDRPPVATTEGQQIHHNTETSKTRTSPAAQVPASGLYDDSRGVLANAIKLAQAGHPILPCYVVNGGDLCTCGRTDKKTGELCRSGKHPNFELAPNGLHNATTDPATLVRWFDATGGRINFGWRLDGLGVWDSDTHGGKTGDQDTARLEDEHGKLTPTLVIRTGRGGTQHIYTLPEGVNTERYADKLATHVDFKRGAGHYVMVPGSKTIDVYRVESGNLLQHAPADEWVLRLALQRKDTENAQRSQADGLIKANGRGGAVLSTESWDSVKHWLSAAVKAGDDPERGNNNAAAFVGGIVRDCLKAGQGIHVAMRLSLIAELQSDDPQHPSVIEGMVRRFWSQSEAERNVSIDRLVEQLEQGGDPAEILAELERDGEFRSNLRTDLIRKLSGRKADRLIEGRTDESELDPEPEDHDAFLNAEPPGWLVEGLWPRGAYGVTAAPKKAGKTWSALDLAIAVASGGKWLGKFQCQKGRVVYALGEGSRFAALQRVRAIAEFHGVSVEELIRSDQFVPVLQPVQITNAKHLQKVREWMDRYQPSLLVIDPFYLSQGGANGTNLAEMGETLREIQVICNSRDCSLMFVHHFKKGSASGTDQMTGVGLGEWARVIGVANVESEERAEQGTKVTLKWHFSGEMAPTSFTVVRRVWSDDPTRQDSPQHYSVEVKEPSGGSANDGKLPLTTVQGLLYDAIAALESATPANVFAWLEQNRKKREAAPSAASVSEGLRKFRDKRPDLIGYSEVGNTVEYRLNDAQMPTLG
ncbi:AAA family ATPase [Streptomyces cinereoruber]|uniref:AAA family ATPase n=1 Tax=Streptomyces cinereoruber TaxID=67260 RepID=UPI00363BAE73